MVEEFDIDIDIQDFCHNLHIVMEDAVSRLGIDKALLFLKTFTENCIVHQEDFFDSNDVS